MSGPMLASIAAILGALVLVGNALRGRHLSAGRGWRLVTIWAAIILTVWLAMAIGLHVR